MHAPQYIHLALVFLSLGIALAEHGKPKSGKHSFPIALFGTALGVLLLWWGGFYSQA